MTTNNGLTIKNRHQLWLWEGLCGWGALEGGSLVEEEGLESEGEEEARGAMETTPTQTPTNRDPACLGQRTGTWRKDGDTWSQPHNTTHTCRWGLSATAASKVWVSAYLCSAVSFWQGCWLPQGPTGSSCLRSYNSHQPRSPSEAPPLSHHLLALPHVTVSLGHTPTGHQHLEQERSTGTHGEAKYRLKYRTEAFDTQCSVLTLT